ncbi:unnamed protein product [Mesocestoides corti]|uniref:protein-serine/threonine phosphatase n=1 Tax=Mesocestoides corti TaxID=53468 RepID=A0A0R3U615_MESCO|nr:unnamed protein product [Mesocestoides corti]
MPLNQAFVKAASHLTGEWCRNNRKLILACDMDETLLTESEDEQHFILRPKVLYMLRNLRAAYELCLVTYSTRERTEQILKIKLDPHGKLFNGRVLCREDVLAGFDNKREALFAHLPQSKTSKGLIKVKKLKNGQPVRPPCWPYIVMLDDFPAAWSNFSSCIPIRPFLIGPGTGSIGKGKTSPKVLTGECGYVLSLYRFLMKLHSAVFEKVGAPATSTAIVPTDISCSPVAGKSGKKLVGKKDTAGITATGNPTAFSALVSLKKRINSAQRFQNMCYVDPGQLLTFDGAPSVVMTAVESKAKSSFGPSFMSVDWQSEKKALSDFAR